ncbi:MAG TPA: protein kinase [Blastocatellia bacterium]|nr:protein kinase [Blastocatellia bacterium]
MMATESVLKIPNVELGARLGEGGFGAVYQGWHQVLEIDVAVKILTNSQSLAGAMSLEQTLREAQFMARLDHPNLLRIFDAARLDDSIYFVLEFMDGGSCAGLHNLPPDRAWNITQQLLSGLQALHDARVLHRDIKPANCLIRTRDGRLKLADLGIAVELATHSERVYNTAGTIPFMAPELFDSPPQYSVQSDLYALGMTLACLLLEADPFPAGSLPEMLAWARNGQHPQLTRLRPDLPPALNRLAERLISNDKKDRPRSATDALAILNEAGIAPAHGSQSPAAPPADRVGPWVIGDQIYASSNWHGFAVTQAETGAAGRLMQLQPGGPLGLARATGMILECAERASLLDHHGIVPVLDWGVRDKLAYVITGQQGRPLDELVKSGGPCSEVVALEFMIALAEALVYLHEKGLVYQIVDPGSTAIAPDARSAQLGFSVFCVQAGTPSAFRAQVPMFAAPEVLARASESIEQSVDLYGLGTILYFLMVGHEAYVSNPRPQTLAHVRGAAPGTTAPTGNVILELMHSDPARRPAAIVVRDELSRILRRLRGR